MKGEKTRIGIKKEKIRKKGRMCARVEKCTKKT